MDLGWGHRRSSAKQRSVDRHEPSNIQPQTAQAVGGLIETSSGK